MKQFCADHGVPLETTGKLIVATTQLEVERMLALFQRAADNGIAAERLNSQELRQLEPNITGLGALHVVSTAITDYRAVCQAMLEILIRLGGETRFGVEVTGIFESADGFNLDLADSSSVTADMLVTCDGLQSDRIVRMAGLALDCRIVPFKGEYYPPQNPIEPCIASDLSRPRSRPFVPGRPYHPAHQRRHQRSPERRSYPFSRRIWTT